MAKMLKKYRELQRIGRTYWDLDPKNIFVPLSNISFRIGLLAKF